MTKTRGPAVYGTVYVNAGAGKPVYVEEEVAWTWAKGMLRKRFPRCTFKQNQYGVHATLKGQPVGLFTFDINGSEVSL